MRHYGLTCMYGFPGWNRSFTGPDRPGVASVSSGSELHMHRVAVGMVLRSLMGAAFARRRRALKPWTVIRPGAPR